MTYLLVVSSGGEEALVAYRFPFPLLIERRSGTGWFVIFSKVGGEDVEPLRKPIHGGQVGAMRPGKDPERVPTAEKK